MEARERTLRVRRLPRRWLLRQYEVDFGGSSPSQITAAPVKLIDPILGVGDAWAVINAADEKWSGGVGPWVSLYPDAEDVRS